MAAYTELESGEPSPTTQTFGMKQVNQEFYFHSQESTLVG